jgi:hypothetical protein
VTTEFPRASAATAMPPVNPSEPATFGVHLAYIASEVHGIGGKVDQVSEKVSALLIEMAKLPSLYASAGTVSELGKRIDQVESRLDKESGAEPSRAELIATVKRLDAAYERLKGGYVWIWTTWGITATLLALGIAAKGRLW